MNPVVAGTGALGCLQAARLAPCRKSDDRPGLFCLHSEQARQITEQGLRLRENGTTGRVSLDATADPERIRGCDLLVLCGRGEDARRCLEKLQPVLSPGVPVVVLQPGADHVEHPLLPASIACVSSGDVFFDSDNTLVCEDPGLFLLGTPGSSPPSADLAAALDCFARAGLRAEKSDNIRRAAWDRLCIDATVNPLAAIYRRPNGQLLTSCSVRGNLKKCLREITTVARALGIELTGDPVQTVFGYLRTNKKRIAPMLRDVGQQRRTDNNALNGYISRLGRELGIPTPVNDDLAERVTGLEAGYR